MAVIDTERLGETPNLFLESIVSILPAKKKSAVYALLKKLQKRKPYIKQKKSRLLSPELILKNM